MTQSILLVEDDDAIADLVHQQLQEAGYQVQRVADGLLAMRAIEMKRYDLVLLDLMLPGADGWEVCRFLHAKHQHVPLIIVSARSAEAHRVLGLELGADDYMVKPFSVLELVARVRALLRRVETMRQPMAHSGELHFGRRHRLDPVSRHLHCGDAPVALTLREFDLLYFLARHPGQVFSRSDLLDRVWGRGFDGYEHTVNSHINRLRTKIEDNPQQPRLIETVWGIGYKFDANSGGEQDSL
jgi:DNA-binding response OmpR family regulator